MKRTAITQTLPQIGWTHTTVTLKMSNHHPPAPPNMQDRVPRYPSFEEASRRKCGASSSNSLNSISPREWLNQQRNLQNEVNVTRTMINHHPWSQKNSTTIVSSRSPSPTFTQQQRRRRQPTVFSAKMHRTTTPNSKDEPPNSML